MPSRIISCTTVELVTLELQVSIRNPKRYFLLCGLIATQPTMHAGEEMISITTNNTRPEMSSDPTEDTECIDQNVRFLWWLTVVACAFILLGSKLWLIANFGSPTPFWDQWDAEASLLYNPHLTDHVPLSTFFSAHNEHRILITRLLALGLLEFSGQWDTILQMCVNASLYTVFLIVLLYLLRDLVNRRFAIILAIFSTFILIFPFGWENTLAGFQSQFYFLLLFSSIALALSSAAAVNTIRWWGGIVLCVLSFFCIASGALTLLIAATVAALQFFLRLRRGIREFAGVAFQIGFAFMLISAIPSLEYPNPLHTNSLPHYFRGMEQSASWPLPIHRLMPFFLFAPVILLFLRTIRQPRTSSAPVWFCLALGGWVLAQHASLAYGRAVGIDSSRYLDLKTTGLIVNFAALLALLEIEWRRDLAYKTIATLLAALWLGSVSVSTGMTAVTRLPAEITSKGESGRTETKNVSAYLKDGDISVLKVQAPLDIPYPSPDRLAMLLSLPAIRGILPPELIDDPAAHDAARRQLWTRGKLRYIAKGLRRSGLASAPYLVFIGLTLLFMVGVLASVPIRRSEAGNTSP